MAVLLHSGPEKNPASDLVLSSCSHAARHVTIETMHAESLILRGFSGWKGFDILHPQLKSVSAPAVFVAVLSETTDSTEEEWQSIADLATACRSILEALSREGGDQLIHAHHLFCFNILLYFLILNKSYNNIRIR